MTELEALLAGIVADPQEETRWLVLADYLEENDDPRRGELLRLHRKLLATCCEPEAHPERKAWQARIVELIAAGVRPCVPQKTWELAGGVPMTFSFIPPGSFLMGGHINEREKPVHKVVLAKGFFLGIHPVTQAHWMSVMRTDPSFFKAPGRPVEQVSWHDCQEFCKKLTADLPGPGTIELPTESEWEYACRSGSTSEYHFGNSITTDIVNYDGNHSWYGCPKGTYREATIEVGSFPVNAWGLSDMHGNVWEFCQDWYGDYPSSQQPSPQPNEEKRILRGGAWDCGPEYCRSSERTRGGPTQSGSRCGFRVCLRQD